MIGGFRIKHPFNIILNFVIGNQTFVDYTILVG
jgi:hypothetical protein